MGGETLAAGANGRRRSEPNERAKGREEVLQVAPVSPRGDGVLGEHVKMAGDDVEGRRVVSVGDGEAVEEASRLERAGELARQDRRGRR